MTRQTIIRAPRAKGFTVINNETLNLQLRPETLGVYVHLLSKPDDWDVQPMALAKHFGIGRDRIYKILSELRSFCVRGRPLMERIEQRDAKTGKVTGYDYIVQEPVPENPEADQSPVPDLPDTALPDTAFQEADKSPPDQSDQPLAEKPDAASPVPCLPLPENTDITKDLYIQKRSVVTPLPDFQEPERSLGPHAAPRISPVDEKDLRQELLHARRSLDRLQSLGRRISDADRAYWCDLIDVLEAKLGIPENKRRMATS